jgi:hypothetical protein
MIGSSDLKEGYMEKLKIYDKENQAQSSMLTAQGC